MKELQDFFNKTNLMQNITGFFVMLLMGSVAYCIMFETVPEGNKELFSHLIGIVEGSFIGGVVQYYHGKSRSENPTETK